MRFRVSVGASTLVALVATAATPVGRPAPIHRSRSQGFAEARAIHRALLARVPAPHTRTVWIGRTPGWLHDHTTAGAELDAMVGADPADARAHAARAYLHAWQAVTAGDLARAETHVARILALDPDDPTARAFLDVLGERRASTGLLARALRLFTGPS